MPDHEAHRRALYDHDEEEPRPTGRRRRQVADWGVGEELFDGMPGRRFERRGVDHRIPRGGADDGRRTIVITEGEAHEVIEAPPVAEEQEFTSREDALRAREEHDAVWAGDEPFAPPPPAPVPAPAPEPEFVEHLDGEPVQADGIVRGGVEGRRTVKIGGRPAEFHSSPARRRPARTVHERLGPRPDRIAAWAFALGLLLILIAVATAGL
jgi:hypothetical protein